MKPSKLGPSKLGPSTLGPFYITMQNHKMRSISVFVVTMVPLSTEAKLYPLINTHLME
jgi:hypothetical protein